MKTHQDIQRWHNHVRNYWPEATEEDTTHILDAHTSWPVLADVVVMEQIIDHLRDMKVITPKRSSLVDKIGSSAHHGRMDIWDRIALEEAYRAHEQSTEVDHHETLQRLDEVCERLGVDYGDDVRNLEEVLGIDQGMEI